MHGKALELLRRNFDMLKKQTFKDFEVIVSDNSEDSIVKNLCADKTNDSLNIRYIKNPRKGLSQNSNESLKHANGTLIKILFMDDYLADENSLQDIVDNFRGGWLVTGCGHDRGDGKIINPHFPAYNKKVYLGKNTIGSPSVLTIPNKDIILFDENLTWLLDCDYYKRLYDKFGKPSILNKINVVIGIGKHQTTNQLRYYIKLKEKFLMWKKYADKKEI